jgi:hypothetical protein
MRRQCLKQTDCLNGQIHFVMLLIGTPASPNSPKPSVKNNGNQDEQSYVDLNLSG